MISLLHFFSGYAAIGNAAFGPLSPDDVGVVRDDDLSIGRQVQVRWFLSLFGIRSHVFRTVFLLGVSIFLFLFSVFLLPLCPTASYSTLHFVNFLDPFSKSCTLLATHMYEQEHFWFISASGSVVIHPTAFHCATSCSMTPPTNATPHSVNGLTNRQFQCLTFPTYNLSYPHRSRLLSLARGIGGNHLPPCVPSHLASAGQATRCSPTPPFMTGELCKSQLFFI